MQQLTALTLFVALAPSLRAQPAVPPVAPYAAAASELEALIAHEVADKRLPALSIALIDDQRVVWARGFGFQDRDRKVPATAETVYRVGSVSKLFTDVAVMQLVEDGKLTLDTPLMKYVPDFKPGTKPEFKPVTLRMLMAHRSGLIREPPVGNYFDPSEPTLKKTVASLNGIELVYPPGERTKYSNGGIGLVGYALQKSQGEKFERYVKRRVLDPLGMTSSVFEPTPPVTKNLADAVMWTVHGREFPAPTFELGEAPAGCMYSTVLDLAKFASCVFAGGKVGGEQLLKPESLAEMLRPQFAKEGDKEGFGLGFHFSDLDGHKRIGHGGAIYGFATDLSLLPDRKLGVVVVCSRDVANTVMNRVSEFALRAMLAAKEGKPLPKPEMTSPLSPDEARALAGRYRSGDDWFDLVESFGKLYFRPANRGGRRIELRKLGKDLVADDLMVQGVLRYTRGDGTLNRGEKTFTKEKPPADPPPEPPAKWKGLIGEYGWDHNTLYIYEDSGRLCALVEWVEFDLLTEESEDVCAFPATGGMYHGEKLIFNRDAAGRATKVEAAKVVFHRRKIDGENGETFKIAPQRPLAELRKEAASVQPPKEAGDFRKPDLVDLATIPGVKFDIRYATDNNFLGTPVYQSAKAYMQRPAAEALGRVHAKLKERGYGLLVYDAYRPWGVTKLFWDATPPKLRNFVADPAKGSRHNRGCAVDLTLYDLKTGKPVEMVSGYDEMTDRAFPEYPGGTSRQRWHRDLLRRAMEAEGFSVYEEEWWHFDYQDWRKYPILNLTFEQLARLP
jgi:serine beta-lactamase-like protein LACTB